MVTRSQQPEGDGEHMNVDGSPDRRFQDNGQGQVVNPDTDMRLKENREDLGNNIDDERRSSRSERRSEEPESKSQRQSSTQGQGRVKDPENDRRLKENN